MPDIVDSLHQKQAVLTHVIDGFLIEESLLPFPVCILVMLKVIMTATWPSSTAHM